MLAQKNALLIANVKTAANKNKFFDGKIKNIFATKTLVSLALARILKIKCPGGILSGKLALRSLQIKFQSILQLVIRNAFAVCILKEGECRAVANASCKRIFASLCALQLGVREKNFNFCVIKSDLHVLVGGTVTAKQFTVNTVKPA